MKIHFNQINSIHHRGVHNKNQITEERYESKGSRTVLKGRWETVMSPIDPNKWAIEQLSAFAPVVTKFGWQTSNLRKHLGLKKQESNKDEAIPATHAFDAVALAASQFIDYLPFENAEGYGHCWQGEVSITRAPFTVIRRPPICRRQLHYMIPSKGGIRQKYGGTVTRHGFRKGDFVGRKELIEEIIRAAAIHQMIVILGIPGIGKSALLAKVASCLDAQQVFWHEFKVELASLDDVLLRLAHFLDNQPESQGNLTSIIQQHQLPKQSQIDRIIEQLNQDSYYLFFDSVESSRQNSEINSFFSLLKDKLLRGTIIITGTSKPNFYDRIDESRQLVKSFQLGGLSEVDVKEFFRKNKIQLKFKNIKAIANRFDGLPLALELVTALLKSDFTEADLMALMDKAEGQVIDRLFDKIYNRLKPEERDLIAIASLTILPLSERSLVNTCQAIHQHRGIKVYLKKLQEQHLIQPIGDNFFQVPKIIDRLFVQYTDNPDEYRFKLANYYNSCEYDDREWTDYYYLQLQAALLYYKVKNYDLAAELVVSCIETGLLPYSTNLTEILLDQFEADMVRPERWMWLVGNKAMLASSWRRYEEAESHCKTMLKLAGELHDRSAAAIALQRLGIAYHGRRNNGRAEECYLNSLALKKELKDIEGQSGIHNQLGLLNIEKGLFKEAKLELNKGLDLLESIDAPDWQKLGYWLNLGIVSSEQKNWQDSAKFNELVRKVAEKMSMPDCLARSIYNLGVDEARQGNIYSAIDYLRESLEIAEKSRLWELQELSQMALGQRYYELGDYDTAITYFEKVVEIHKKVQDKNQLAVLYFGIGNFYSCKNDKKMTLVYYQKVMELFESWADEEQISNFFNNVWVLANHSDSPKQIVLSLKLLKARLKKNPPSYKLARLYGTLGRIYQELIQRPTLAISYLRQEIKLFAALNRTHEQVQAISNLAVLYEQHGSYQLALDTNTEALNLADTYNFEEEVARLLYNRANCFTLIEMWAQGEADYNHSLLLAEKQNNIELKNEIFHNLGETYSRWGKFDQAIALLNRSLEFSQQKEDIDNQLLAMNNLGIAYRKNDQYQEAIECSSQALALSRKYYKKSDEAKILVTLGNAIRFQDKLEEAKTYYEESLAVARSIEDISLEQDSFLSLAYVHHELGTLDSLEAEFQDVVDRAVESNSFEPLVKFTSLLGKAYLEEGNIEESAEMFKSALLFATLVYWSKLSLKKSSLKLHYFGVEIKEVRNKIYDCLEMTINKDSLETAKAMYNCLISKLENLELGEKQGLWLANILKPIEENLLLLTAITKSY